MLPTSTYPTWYNVIPLFVPLDFSSYPTYPTGTKGHDFSIFRNYIGYVPRNVYPIFEQPIVPLTYIPYFVGNQFPIVVYLVTTKDIQPIQQPVTAPIPTTIQVTTNLPTYVPRGSTRQPLNGGQPGDSPRKSSPRGDLHGAPPFNPLVGSFGWPTPNSRMFIPPWYQPFVVQLVLESTPNCHTRSYNIQLMS
jgi:hypothetical protein